MDNAEKLRIIKNDPVLWIQTFVKIVDKEGKLVPFIFNPYQKYILKHKQKFNICLKSRQLGITSVALAFSLYLAINKPYSSCLIMSHSKDSAFAIFEKLKQMYDNLPDCVRVETRANNRSELKLMNHSQIVVCTCGTKDNARGMTLNFAHFSEVGLMNENLQKQLVAVEQAVVADGIMILESTAQGMNTFYEMWSKSVSGESPIWKPFFFSWVHDKMMHAKEQQQYADLFKDLNGHYLTENELDADERILFDKGASLTQLMWRRIIIMRDGIDYFHQEYPSTASEAFLSTGSNVFNSSLIVQRINNLYLTKTVQLEANKLDAVLRKYQRYLTIWKAPVNKAKYYIGVDIGEGLGGANDYSVITVIDDNGFECAEWRSNKVKPYEVTDVAYQIGKLYNNGLLVVEKASAGHTVIDRLYHDKKYINLYKYKAYDQSGKMKKQLGWNTDSKSRPIMIADFQEWFETGKCLVNSKACLQEMKLFQLVNDKMQAASGHDDCVLSYAMAIQGFKSRQYYYPLGK